MSNRYIVEGLVRDLRAGKRVLLIAPTRLASRHTFLNVLDSILNGPGLPRTKRVHRAQGREYIEMDNGGTLTVATLDGARGRVTDTIVLLQWEQVIGEDWPTARDRLDYLQAFRAELVQA